MYITMGTNYMAYGSLLCDWIFPLALPFLTDLAIMLIKATISESGGDEDDLRIAPRLLMLSRSRASTRLS